MNGNNSKNNIQLGEFLFSRIYSNDEHNKTGIIVTRVDQQMSTKSRRDRHNSRSNKQDKTRRSRRRRRRSTRKCSKDETGSISNSSSSSQCSGARRTNDRDENDSQRSSSSQCSGTRRTNDRDENDSQRSSSSRRRRTRRNNDRDEKDKQRSRGSRHTTSSRHTSSRKNGNNKWSSNQQKALEAKAATLCQLIADQGLFEKNKNNPDQREFMGYELINHMILIGMCDTRREGVRFGKDLSKRLNLFDRIDDDDDDGDANKDNTFSDDMNVYKLRGAFKSILNISKNIDEAWRTDQDKVERSKNSKRKSDKKKKMKKKKEIKPIKEIEHEVVKTMKKQLRRHYQTEQVNHTEALMNELKAKTSSMYTGHHRIITADQGITTIDEEKEEKNGITSSTASKTTSKSDAIVSIEEEEEKSYMEFTVLDYEEEIIEESVDDNNDDDDDDSFIEMTVMEEDDEESYAEYTIVEEDDDNFCPTDVKHSSFQTTPKRSNSSLIIKNSMGAYGMEIAFRDLDDDEITQITMLPF